MEIEAGSMKKIWIQTKSRQEIALHFHSITITEADPLTNLYFCIYPYRIRAELFNLPMNRYTGHVMKGEELPAYAGRIQRWN